MPQDMFNFSLKSGLTVIKLTYSTSLVESLIKIPSDRISCNAAPSLHCIYTQISKLDPVLKTMFARTIDFGRYFKDILIHANEFKLENVGINLSIFKVCFQHF